MRRSLRGVLSRANQLAERARALKGDGLGHVSTILTAARRRWSERQRMFAERGYPETATERYARHLERKSLVAAEDIPGLPERLRWFFRRQLKVWTRLEPEYAAEAAREKAGYPPAADPAWWLASDDQFRQSAGVEAPTAADKVIELRIAEKLIEMRRARQALLEARRAGGGHA